MPVFEELRGERVLVRPYRLEDAQPQFEAVMESRDHLLPWLPFAAQYATLDDSRDFVRRCAAWWMTRERLIVSLWDVASGRFIGGSHLGPNWEVPSFEIGYWVRASAQGRGYITESTRLLADYAFSAYGARRVFLRCDARNTRSAAVPERLGFVCEARLRSEAIAYDGVLRDTLIYAATPEDWAARPA
jgi:RimJ/RimL family protein N-acetyltransferase